MYLRNVVIGAHVAGLLETFRYILSFGAETASPFSGTVLDGMRLKRVLKVDRDVIQEEVGVPRARVGAVRKRDRS